MSVSAICDLTDLICNLLSSNRAPGYGVTVTSASPDLSRIEVDFRFLSGRTYCCAEPGCHLPRKCERLIQLAAERAISLPKDVVVFWHCRVEQGTRLECLKALGRPLECDAYEFEAITGETDPLHRVAETP